MFKKYKVINGKKYGPYYYESKRVGDKVKTIYLGQSPPKDVGVNAHLPSGVGKFNLVLGIVGLLLVMGLAFSVLDFSPTGEVTLELNGNYDLGEIISGKPRYSLK